MTVFKYVMSDRDCAIEMPQGAEVLSCMRLPDGAVCIYALVDREASLEQRFFVSHGTGDEIPNASVLTFVGTFREPESENVFHVFEMAS